MNAYQQEVVRAGDLVRGGLSRTEIRALLAAGRLVRIRHGWYARPAANPDAVRAVQLGGTLSCLSALRLHGVWVLPDGQLHLRMSEHHRGSRKLPPGVHLCHSPERVAPGLAVDSVETALASALRCLDDEGIVVVLDSILNQQLLGRTQVMSLLASEAGHVRRLLAETDGQSQSGIESMVRFRLRRRGIKVRTQVQLPGVGRVDLLVGERLVLECDGRAYHLGEEAYEGDRRRDRITVRDGRFAMRLTYRNVVQEWDEVLSDILTIVLRDGHRITRRRRKPGSCADPGWFAEDDSRQIPDR